MRAITTLCHLEEDRTHSRVRVLEIHSGVSIGCQDLFVTVGVCTVGDILMAVFLSICDV